MQNWTLNAVLFAVGVSFAVGGWLAADEHSPADRQAILDRNLFASTVEPAPPPVRQQNLEKSRLPVTLLGTFAADEPSLSRATLHDRETKQTLVVGIGDQIADQALVVQIERGRVALRENGEHRELVFERIERASPVRENRFVPSESGHSIFEQLLGQGRVLPKFEDGGQMVGLEVSLIQAGSLFEEIGLANGDVITEFNGVPVDSQAEIANVLQEMSDAGEVHLVGRRADGSEQVWDFVPSGQ